MNTFNNGSSSSVRARRSRLRANVAVLGTTALLLGTVATPTAHSMSSSGDGSLTGPRQQADPESPTDHHKLPDALPYYVIPGGCVSPESVAVYGGKYYTGGVCNGKLYRGDLTKRRAKILVPSGRHPVVMGGVEATANRLVVANGGSGFATVYNRFNGKRVARFFNGLPHESIVNDVAVTPNGDAYITEFERSKLYRIPAAGLAHHQRGRQELPVWLDFRGTPFHVQAGSANGIAATPDGRFLIVAQFSDGDLYRVRIRDQHVSKIRLHGKHLAGPDGIVLSNADVLYAVETEKQRVAEIRLSDHYERGRLVSRTTSPRFKCPSGVDIAGDRLLVSNLGYGCPFELPWTVVSIRTP